MADDYYWNSNSEMNENLFWYAGFPLNADEVAQENQYPKSNDRAETCCVVYWQEREQNNKRECNGKSGYEVAYGEHSRVFFFCGGGFSVNVDSERVCDVICHGYHKQRPYYAGFWVARSYQPKDYS